MWISNIALFACKFDVSDPRGFAFVVFADGATVDLVMADKDKHEINHKLVDVKRAQARGVAPPSIHEKQMAAAAAAAAAARASSGETGTASGEGGSGDAPAVDPSPEQLHCKLFVGGIPPQVDRDELKQIFEKFGVVVDAIVMVDQATQRSRCFGFVTFDQVDGPNAANRAILAQPLEVYGRSVEVKLATPRTEQVGTQGVKRVPTSGPKHLGLRAGQTSSASSGEFAGLAVAYGRSGWKAGYGTKAFGKAGWNVWEDTGGAAPEKSGFSFQMLKIISHANKSTEDGPPIKRPRH